MATGLQVWAQNGTLLIDTTSSVALILGTFAIGGAGSAQSGSITDARLGNGRPFAFQLLGGIPGADNKEAIITTSANGVSWSYPSAEATYESDRPRATIMYGTF